MVGAGVFTMLGLQLEQVTEPFSILLLWLVGGLLAFCGAIGYSRLAKHLPRSGGEYHFLSKIYGPSLGFSAAMVSIFAGFAAPLALTASAFWLLLSEFPAGFSPACRLYPDPVGDHNTYRKSKDRRRLSLWIYDIESYSHPPLYRSWLLYEADTFLAIGSLQVFPDKKSPDPALPSL